MEEDCCCYWAVVSLFVLEADDSVIVRKEDYLYITAVAVKLIVWLLVF